MRVLEQRELLLQRVRAEMVRLRADFATREDLDLIVVAIADGALCEDSEMITKAYAQAVPMGSDLPVSANTEQKPTLLAVANKDPQGLDLQALHLIKGWVHAEGRMHSQVIPIVEAENGSSQLCVVYSDDGFDASQSAYYYLRAVEPSVPRWHTYDCEKLPEADRPAVCNDGTYPSTVQEMAWSSPIWYQPQ